MNSKTVIISILSAFVVLCCVIFGAFYLFYMKPSSKDSGSESLESAQAISKADKEEESKTETLNGWKEEGNDKYYYKDNEKMTGWINDDNKWYYLGSDGKMRTGWIRDKDRWYYMNDDGSMATNTTVDGCYLDENGTITDTPKKDTATVDNYKPSSIQYTTYTNTRYGFSVDYPIGFVAMAPPTNNDGRSFQRNDGNVTVTAYGSNNALYESIEYYYNQCLQGIHGTITYDKLNNSSYAVSWLEDGMVKYEYSILGKNSLNTFYVSYPVSEKDKYDSMVDHIYQTFKTPGIDEYH